jgi:microcystin-dependent protein
MSQITLYHNSGIIDVPNGASSLYLRPDKKLYIIDDLGSEYNIPRAGDALSSISVVPPADGTGNVGSNALRFNDIHAINLYGNIDFNAANSSGIKAVVGTMVSSNTETNISVTYNSLTEKLDFVINGGHTSGLDADTLDGLHSAAFALQAHTHYSTEITDFVEAAQDAAVAALTNGTHTNITVTYDDVNDKVNLAVVSPGLDADTLDGQHGTYYAPINSPALTGTPTAPTAVNSDNSTAIATTAFVKNQNYVTTAQAMVFPTGMLAPYAGLLEPAGWIFCHGQAISRTTFSDLFSAVGTTYGVGDGSTTFNVPDLRGRTIAGVDNMGGTSAGRITSGGSGISGTTLGASGGEEVHTLTMNEGPAYTRSLDAGTLTGTGSGSGALLNSNEPGVVVDGGGSPHQNTQPTIMLNYIIKI